MSVSEVAKRFGVSDRTVRNWARAKRLKGNRVNEWTWIFAESDVEKFAASWTPSKRGRKPKSE